MKSPGVPIILSGCKQWKPTLEIYWKCIESLFGRILEASKDSKGPREPDLGMDSKQAISRRRGRQTPTEHMLLEAIWSGRKEASTFSVSCKSTDFSVYFCMS